MSGTQERWWCNSSPAGRLETRKADVSICVQNSESSHSTCLDRKFPLTHGKVNLCSFQALSWLDGATYINRCSYKMGLSRVPELKPIWTLKQDSMLLVFQIDEQVCAKKYNECSSRSWKSMEMGFFLLKPLERLQAGQYIDFSPVKLIWIFCFQNYKRINECCFKLPNLLWFVTVAIEN